MFASSTWEVQMLEFAFSRRICCSRVCIAMRSAVLPAASFDTPIIRPGIERLYSSFAAKNAARSEERRVGKEWRSRWWRDRSQERAAGGGGGSRTRVSKTETEDRIER